MLGALICQAKGANCVWLLKLPETASPVRQCQLQRGAAHRTAWEAAVLLSNGQTCGAAPKRPVLSTSVRLALHWFQIWLTWGQEGHSDPVTLVSVGQGGDKGWGGQGFCCFSFKPHPTARMLLVAMPGAPSSVLAPSSKARSP